MDAIRASTNIFDLTGEGTEYLLGSDGLPVARFIDGHLVQSSSFPNSKEDTKVST